jgi:hypothetical protein
MPLPTVEDVSDPNELNNPKMKVTLGTGNFLEEAVLSVNEEGEACDVLQGIEFCAERECLDFSKDTGVCDLRSSKVCLFGYDPHPTAEAGYHPSKGVLIQLANEQIASTPPNSVEGNKIYFDIDGYFSSNNILPASLVHRPFTPEELGLCIGGTWRWPATGVHSTPGVEAVDVDPSCLKIKATLWGAGAASGWQQGGGNALQNDYAGGAGGYIEGEFEYAGEEIQLTIGAGGSGNRANGTNTVLRVGTNVLMTANAGVKHVGGGASNGAQVSSVIQYSGETKGVLPNGSKGPTPIAGGRAFKHLDGQKVPLARQEANLCASGTGSAGRAPLGGGGCGRDDTPGNGKHGDGGHGGAILECLLFADDEPVDGPMPQVTSTPPSGSP